MHKAYYDSMCSIFGMAWISKMYIVYLQDLNFPIV